MFRDGKKNTMNKSNNAHLYKSEKKKKKLVQRIKLQISDTKNMANFCTKIFSFLPFILKQQNFCCRQQINKKKLVFSFETCKWGK